MNTQQGRWFKPSLLPLRSDGSSAWWSTAFGTRRSQVRILSIRPINFCFSSFTTGVAQLDRASACLAEGRRFESCSRRHSSLEEWHRFRISKYKKHSRFNTNFVCWCFSGGGTPVLIPNTAVKLSIADGTP